jgi:guanyl-specific ribonuclease Sa
MFKKALAILLAGSMVMSSAVVVMAGDSEEAKSEVESVATAESAAATESTSAEEAENDSADFRALAETILTKIGEAVEAVDLEEKEEALGKEFSEDGTVFSIFENILSDIDERMSAEGKEDEGFLKEALDALGSIEEIDEKELDGILESVLLELISDEVEEDLEEESLPEDIDIANAAASFVFEAAKENELIAEAVEATGSELFDMLSTSSEKLEEAADDGVEMVNVEEIAEEPFEKFEEELAKVTDYINEQDGPKQAALDIVNLVHDVVDEIHFAVHGHTHEALE